ncbi:hypothetical protein B0H10DRAFT_2044612 [Mycena sp. CBHHK59/15]|nr:hypothetical protein B0H10DRAFT_2044612 [Mycena sp. CBHHK59/15]
MVASKTKKVIKFTYAERVLGSFSLIQREHKKHAIHIASLRAQVQKTAQARKDKLGPHWKNWVGKALHRLEEDGILAASEPSGTVVLTPNGRKAIAAARRTFSLPANDNLSPEQEALLWKHVTQQASAQSFKRTLAYTSDDGESDDEPEYLPHKPKKRARTSLATSVKTADPLAKMTKAQLIEQVASLERAREADMLRAASPLTELGEDDTEEVMRLKEVIKHREEEMDAIRRELAGVRGRISRPISPDPSSDVFMSSPARRDTRAHLVTRTQSGSLIDHLSKQPTPAPTERDPYECNDDTYDESDNMHPVFAGVLATPESSPAKGNPQSKEAVLLQEVERYKNQLEELKKNTEARHKISTDKVSSLERSLASRATDLQSLEHKLSEIKLQHAQRQISLSDKDSHMSILQTNLKTLEAQMTEKDATIALNSSRISDLERSKADLEASITERVLQFEQLVRERDDAVANLKNETTKYELEISRLQQALSDTEQQIDVHVADIQAGKVETASLNSKIASLQHELDSQVKSNAALLKDRTRLESELTELRVATGASDAHKQSLLKSIGELDRRISEHVAAQRSLEEELARSAAEVSAASERLRAAQAHSESLSQQLADATAKQSATEASLANERSAIEALRPQIATLDDALTEKITTANRLQERLGEAQREAKDSRLKLGILETTLSNVRASLEARQLEVDNMKTDLAQRMAAHAALASALQERDRQLMEADVAKGELQVQVEEATSNLQIALDAETTLQKSRDTLADELATADAAKELLIANIASTSSALQQTADRLEVAESMEGMLRSEVAARESEMQQLSTQKDGYLAKIHEVEQALDVAQSKHVSEIAERESAKITLEQTFLAIQGDVAVLTLELDAIRQDREDVRAHLQGDVSRITDALAAERLRGKLLEADLADAIGMAQEAEEELLELRAMKDTDAATIEGLKETFAKLKKAQTDSLAELDYKLESAHPSPVPRRRASKIPERST